MISDKKAKTRQRGEPARWAGFSTCSRSVFPWEKRLANP